MREVILDTNCLLDNVDLSQYSKVYLPITVIEELDKIKHGIDGEKSYKARRAIRQIEDATNVECKPDYTLSLPLWLDRNVPDNKILGFANEICSFNKDALLLSNDVNMRIKARALGIPCEKYNRNDKSDEIYKGFKEIILDEYQMSLHYQCSTNNYGLLNNEYIIIKDGNGEIVDSKRWTDEKGFVSISTKGLNSIYLDEFKPKDIYQMFAIDSLNNTDFSLFTGMAGTGKTQLALSYIMQSLDSKKNTKGKVIIIFNPAKLKNNEQLGYYSGSRTEKLLQNSIGGILSSKLGSVDAIETLINQGKMMIIPTSDIRGIEISDKDILYVTEAQNTDAYTMRTILQRAKDKCKIIVEGDMLEQRDLRNSNPNDNGMMRVIDVFKGTKYFSCVELQKTYRSPISEIAQRI